MPGFGATRSSTDSRPAGPKPSALRSSTTSSDAPGIARPSSSSATRFSSGRGRLRAPGAELRRRASPRRASASASAASASAPRSSAPSSALDLLAAALGVGEHRLDAAAVLAQQPVERVEPFLDREQPAGVGLDPLGVVAQPGGDVTQLDRERGEPLGEPVELGVDSGERPASATPPGPARAAAPPPSSSAPATRRVGAGRRLAQPLGVAQALALGRELGLLGRVGRDLLDLGELVAIEVEVALPRAVALAQLGQLSAEPQALAVGLGVALAQRQVLGAGEAVEHVHLGRGDRQPAVLVLAVEGEQPAAEQLQVGGRGGAPADKGRGPPRGGRDPAPEDDLLGARRQALGQLGQLRLLEQPGGQVEDALDPGLLGARAGRSAAAPCRPSAGRASGRGPSCRRRSRR